MQINLHSLIKLELLRVYCEHIKKESVKSFYWFLVLNIIETCQQNDIFSAKYQRVIAS